MKTPQEKGRAFEREWALRMGGSLQPASGALWFAKMDARSKGILWSLKHTVHRSQGISVNMVDEVVKAAQGMAGEDLMPAIGIRIHEDPRYDMVVLRAEDFLELVNEERELVMEDRSAAKRRRAAIPELLRED